jgi:hypothetical protein
MFPFLLRELFSRTHAVEATDLIGNLLSFINSTLAVFSKVPVLTKNLSSSYSIDDLMKRKIPYFF